MLKSIIPFTLFVILLVFLAWSLKLDPKEIPSPLVDKPIPHFDLPMLSDPSQNLQPEQLQGRVWILNVWSSWCLSCEQEIPVLKDLSQKYPDLILGLNYKDEPEEARNWLMQHGNPYAESLMDVDGVTGIDLGVYGVPETYVIDKKGRVRLKHTGLLDVEDLNTKILPLLHVLESET